ncbi:MAG: hypothetical protein ACOYXN_05225 [Acidobacteriota bacterium]
MRRMLKNWLAAGAMALGLPLLAAGPSGFTVEVLVDGVPRPEYAAGEKVYVEALRGREYALRLTNPLGRRVAVALSVDGLNTVNAQRSDPARATKWVLDPYETVVISGWQVSGGEARRFFFTGEKRSYGAWLGQTENLGTIEAVFFAEKVRCPAEVEALGGVLGGETSADEGAARRERPSAQAPAPSSRNQDSKSLEKGSDLSDDYAATGIGRRMRHSVNRVSLDLEETPSASVRLRYEFRPQLVALGVLPPPPPKVRPLDRRERATGFEGAWCPDPSAGR